MNTKKDITTDRARALLTVVRAAFQRYPELREEFEHIVGEDLHEEKTREKRSTTKRNGKHDHAGHN